MAFIKPPIGSKLTFILILPFFLLWAADIKVLRGRLILIPYYHPRSGLFRIHLDAYDDLDALMEELLFGFYYKFYSENLGHVVIDVGANIGDFCIPLSRHVREVIAIEGYAPTYYRLVKNICVDKCHNITAFFALAGEGGDELFAGYDHYRVLYAAQKFGLDRIAKALPVAKVLRPLILRSPVKSKDRLLRGYHLLEQKNTPDFVRYYYAVLPEEQTKILGIVPSHPNSDDSPLQIRQNELISRMLEICQRVFRRKTITIRLTNPPQHQALRKECRNKTKNL